MVLMYPMWNDKELYMLIQSPFNFEFRIKNVYGSVFNTDLKRNES